MNRSITSLLSRRDVLRAGIAGGVAMALGVTVAQSADSAPILKAIPSSGEALLEAPPSPCIKCDTAAEYFDALGRLYCAKHGTER